MWRHQHSLALIAGLTLGMSMICADEPPPGPTAQIAAPADAVAAQRPFSFQREVGAVLTRYGCNAAECHGGVKGRGGFKLSLGGLYPRQDYHWITRGGDFQVLADEPGGEPAPRIDLEHPEQSLLLLKPTEQVDHEGGERFEKESAAYRTLVDWVRRGAPLSEDGAARFRIERIEASPYEVIVGPRDEQQVRVTAILAGGAHEDVTDEVHFAINNEEVASIDEAGLVTGNRSGETDLLIRAAGKATSLRIGVIERRLEEFPEVPANNEPRNNEPRNNEPLTNEPLTNELLTNELLTNELLTNELLTNELLTNEIDDHIFAKLRRFHTRPAELSSDAEFLRRVCLDLTGTLPPPDRVREFIADEDPHKRQQLINILLDSPEYIDYWTFRFADLFRVTDSSYWSWLRDSIAANMPYNEMASARISAVGAEGPAKFYGVKVLPMADVLAEDFRLFLGRRLDCAQCHDHPWDTWSQDQFWGIAAFYSQLTMTEWIDNQVVYDDPDGQEIDWGVDGIRSLRYHQPIHPRKKQLVEQNFFDGSTLQEDQLDSPRQQLAELITGHPYFAEALVNRVWSYFFHRGFVEPVDHFSSVNPPSHPQLLAVLAEQFRANGYDLKQLMRAIVRSRTYQLSATPDETNRSDQYNFSHARPRPLVAEVLLDAVAQAVGVPVSFQKVITSGAGRAPPGRRAIQLKAPAKWSSRFLEIYNRPFRRTLPERDGEPNLQQAMHILVGETYNEHLSAPGGRLDRLLTRGASNRQVVEELYLAALSRPPTVAESEAIVARLGESAPIVESSFFTQTEERRAALEDLLWAILCSREFAYNH